MDWKIIVLVAGQFLVFVANIGCFAIIKFNDLHHLGKDVAQLKEDKIKFQDELKASVKSIEESVKKVSDTVIGITARCEERHKD